MGIREKRSLTSQMLSIDGMPLDCFIEPLAVSGNVIRPFTNLGIKDDGGLRTKLVIFFLRKLISISERIKIAVSRPFGEICKKDVLFLAYTNQIFKNKKTEFLGFNDVVKELKKQGVKPLVIVSEPISKNSLFKLREHERLLHAFVNKHIIKKSEELAKELNHKWKKLSEPTRKIFVNVCGGSETAVGFLMSKEILWVFIFRYLTFKEITEKVGAQIIYLTGLNGVDELALLGVAHRLNRKVVYSPHGGYIPSPLPEIFSEKIFYAMWGRDDKKRLRSLNVRADRIFTVGSPFFDKIVRYRKKKRRRKKKTVVLLTKAVYETPMISKKQYFNYFRNFLDQVNMAKGVGKIIIKLHPIEKKYKSDYESVVKSLGLKNIKISDDPRKEVLYHIMSDADLLLSYGSATDVEGMIMGKNIIAIRGLTPEIGLKDVVFLVDKNGDLKGTIENLLNDKKIQKMAEAKRRRYLKGAFHKIDGKAYKRVAALIKDLMAGERSV